MLLGRSMGMVVEIGEVMISRRLRESCGCEMRRESEGEKKIRRKR